MKILKEYLRAVLSEYWGEPIGGVRPQLTKADPTMPDNRSDVKSPGSEAKEDLLMLDEPGVIVEPDVRKKIKAYFSAMKLVPGDKPGKTYK
jgi:hypothetical protein